MTGPIVGVDLGGTSIRAAMAAAPSVHGPPVHRDTRAADGPLVVLEQCADAVREVCGGRVPAGVAIGIPGPLDPSTGIVFATPYLRDWANVNARDVLSGLVGCPVAIENDARVAGYAEWTAGAGKGTDHFVFMTVSTGIGGAIVLNGVLHNGAAGTAGEVGHVAAGIDGPSCGQGHPGCLAGVASGTAIARLAQAAVRDGVETSLRAVPVEKLTAVDVHAAAVSGDPVAVALYRSAGHALGRAVGTLINLVSPEVVAIGGGLMQAGEILFAPLRSSVHEIAFDQPLARCRIERAALGTDAGLVGAVAWAVKQFDTA